MTTAIISCCYIL